MRRGKGEKHCTELTKWKQESKNMQGGRLHAKRFLCTARTVRFGLDKILCVYRSFLITVQSLIVCGGFFLHRVHKYLAGE